MIERFLTMRVRTKGGAIHHFGILSLGFSGFRRSQPQILQFSAWLSSMIDH